MDNRSSERRRERCLQWDPVTLRRTFQIDSSRPHLFERQMNGGHWRLSNRPIYCLPFTSYLCSSGASCIRHIGLLVKRCHSRQWWLLGAHPINNVGWVILVFGTTHDPPTQITSFSSECRITDGALGTSRNRSSYSKQLIEQVLILRVLEWTKGLLPHMGVTNGKNRCTLQLLYSAEKVSSAKMHHVVAAIPIGSSHSYEPGGHYGPLRSRFHDFDDKNPFISTEAYRTFDGMS